MLGLFVGINDYPGTDSDLGGCIDDANDWAAFFSTYLTEQPTMLLNEGATKDRILSHLQAKVTHLRPGELFVFTYSGHGTWMPDMDGDEPDGRDEALCPFDMSETNLVLDDEIAEIFARRHPDSKILMITDSCHSGTVFRMAGVAEVKKKIRFLPPANFVKDPLKLQRIAMTSTLPRVAASNKATPGVIHFAGCSDAQYCYDTQFNGKPNGAFTRTMLDTLKEGNCASYGDLIKAVREKLPSFDYPQTPRLNVSRKLRQATMFT